MSRLVLVSVIRTLLRKFIIGSMVLFFAGPVLMIVLSSFGYGLFLEFPPREWTFEWYRLFFNDPSWTSSLFSSFGIALIVTLLTLPTAGLAAAWVANHRTSGSEVFSILFLLPLFVPVIIYAVAFYGMFAHWRIFGDWLNLSLSHTVLAFPLAFLILRSGFISLNREYAEIARTLGARRIQIAWQIQIPLLKWHLLFAAVTIFVYSFTEPVMAIFLTSGETATLPKKTWEGLRYGIDPRTVVGTAILLYVFVLVLILSTAYRSFYRRHMAISREYKS